MRIAFETRELERICTDERYMQRKLGANVSRALKLRIAELRYQSEMHNLLQSTGRWEELAGDRAGQWSARLNANWRLIVEPEATEVVTVTIIEIIDYH